MYIKDITFTDFNGNIVTEKWCFNLNKVELMDLNYSIPGGFASVGEKAIKEQNTEMLYKLYKQLVLAAVGKKSEDGKRFIKNQEILNEFTEGGAFPEFLVSLAEDTNLAEEFMAGILPNGADAIKMANQQISSMNIPSVVPAP